MRLLHYWNCEIIEKLRLIEKLVIKSKRVILHFLCDKHWKLIDCIDESEVKNNWEIENYWVGKVKL